MAGMNTAEVTGRIQPNGLSMKKKILNNGLVRLVDFSVWDNVLR